MSAKIIALVGPSGVGKNFVKEAIKKKYPELKELTVYTTRKRRESDGIDRKTDIDVNDFLKMEQGGEFIGAHRPFADKGDWYGFLKEEIDNIIKNNEVALTEIHIDNLILFKELYGKNISSLALVADKEYLKYNLELRNSEVDEEKEIRLKKAETEIMNIKNLKNQKIIDILVEVNKNNRNELAEIVLDKIKKEMELDIKWENKIKFK